jgi:hypothetical protein
LGRKIPPLNKRQWQRASHNYILHAQQTLVFVMLFTNLWFAGHPEAAKKTKVILHFLAQMASCISRRHYTLWRARTRLFWT